MAGVDVKRRGKILEEYVGVHARGVHRRAVRRARAATIQVTPKPFTDPHPTILVGGGVEAAARRAARLRLPMMPMHGTRSSPEWYRDEAAKTGFEGGYVMRPSGPTFVHVSHDPDAAWAEIGAVRAVRGADLRRRSRPAASTRRRWSTPRRSTTCRAVPQCSSARPTRSSRPPARSSPMGALTFNPLAGGLPPDSRGRASSCSRPRCCRGSGPAA